MQRRRRAKSDAEAGGAAIVPLRPGPTDELARLRAEVERQRREAAAFAAITHDFAAALNGDMVLASIADHARALLDGFFARIVLFDPAQGRLRSVADCGAPAGAWPDDPRWPNEGVVGHVWQTGRPLRVADYLNDERFVHLPALDGAIRSAGSLAILCVPIALGEEPLGVLMVGDRGGREFTTHEEGLLARLAEQAALALRNARLYADAQGRAARLELLNAIGRELSAALDLEQFLVTAWRQLLRVVRVEECWIGLWHEAREEMQLLLYVSGGERRRDWQVSVRPRERRGLSSVVIDEDRTLRADNYLEECARRGIAPVTPTGDWSHLAWLGVPLRARGRLVGVLGVERHDGSFSAEEAALLETLSGLLGAGLENARLFAEAQRRADELAVLNEVATLTSSSLELPEIFRRLYRAVARVLPADAFLVTLVDEAGDARHTLAIDNGREYALDGARPLHQGLRTALRERRPVQIDDLPAEPDPAERFGDPERVARSMLAAPLLSGERCLGLLAVQSYRPAVYGPEHATLLGAIARQAASAVENARLFAHTRDLYLGSVESLATAVDAKDPYTHGHSRQVAYYARRIAEELGLPREQIELVDLAGLLHDVGKIGIPDHILQKPGALDPAERALMQGHATRGAAILAGNAALAPLAPMVRGHHERWDGRGYPDRLAGAAIPLGAAIVCAADSFDTMTRDRPYQRAMALAAARAELRRCDGAQFHPRVVAALGAVLDADEAAGAPYLLALRQAGAGARTPEATDHALDDRGLRVLLRITHELGALDDLDAFLGRVVATLGEELGWDHCGIMLLDEAAGELELVQLHGGAGRACGFRLPLDQGICGWVARHREAQNVPDTLADSRYTRPAGLPYRSCLAAPLLFDGRVIGVLVVESMQPAAFTLNDERLLTVIAGQLAPAITTARLHDEVKRQARVDALTGLANRRTFDEAVEAELAASIRAGGALAVAMLDVNGLKPINDRLGHAAGDAALRGIAEVLGRTIRAGDLAARIGGDEFALLLPGASAAEAEALVARLAPALAAGRFVADGVEHPLPVVPIGVAVCPVDGRRPAELLAAADRRLYAHKQLSRDRAWAVDGR